ILGKVLNSLFVPDGEDQTPRHQQIDGKNLPPFEDVRGYFGPAGLFGVSEEHGYFFKGFLLEKTGKKSIK
ncbi:MAG: hypothetical protein ACRCUY_07710, partial [Thermoguttaceae bacterium]